MVFKIFSKKIGLEARANVNEELAHELNKASSKEYMQDLKTLFEQLI